MFSAGCIHIFLMVLISTVRYLSSIFNDTLKYLSMILIIYFNLRAYDIRLKLKYTKHHFLEGDLGDTKSDKKINPWITHSSRVVKKCF